MKLIELKEAAQRLNERNDLKLSTLQTWIKSLEKIQKTLESAESDLRTLSRETGKYKMFTNDTENCYRIVRNLLTKQSGRDFDVTIDKVLNNMMEVEEDMKDMG